MSLSKQIIHKQVDHIVSHANDAIKDQAKARSKAFVKLCIQTVLKNNRWAQRFVEFVRNIRY